MQNAEKEPRNNLKKEEMNLSEPDAAETDSDEEDVSGNEESAPETLTVGGTVDKSIDTYKKGKGLVDRGKEVLEIVNAIKMRAIITAACIVLSIVFAIATPFINKYIEKSAEEESTSVELGTQAEALTQKAEEKAEGFFANVKEKAADAKEKAADVKEKAAAVKEKAAEKMVEVRALAENTVQNAGVDAQVQNDPANNPLAPTDNPNAPAGNSNALADNPTAPAGNSVVPVAEQKPSNDSNNVAPQLDLMAAIDRDITELSTSQLRQMIGTMQMVASALEDLTNDQSGVDCSGSGCEQPYYQKMSTLLKKHSQKSKGDEGADREKLLVGFGELKSRIQRVTGNLKAALPTDAYRGIEKAIAENAHWGTPANAQIIQKTEDDQMIAANTENANHAEAAANDADAAANDTAVAANDTAVAANDTAVAANDTAVAANDTAVAANDADAAANHAVPLAANQSDLSSSVPVNTSASVNTNVSANTHARSGSSGGCLGSVLSGVGKFFGGLFLIGFIVVLYKLGIVKH
ncbi:MAG: hypothetical protein IJM59_08475 [Proteobacteria bacterium]|nr:hypothetical protein [Pseudomonadota bacterium]